jgi:hypothetical protein
VLWTFKYHGATTLTNGNDDRRVAASLRREKTWTLATLITLRGGVTTFRAMQQLTPAGQNIIADIARRYNLSHDSAISMLIAVNNGGGTMAQFSCPNSAAGSGCAGG